MPPYPKGKFYYDLMEVTKNQSDPELANHLVNQSYETIKLMHSYNIDFDLIYGNHSFEKNEKFLFWSGLPVKTSGEGVGLIQQLNERVEEHGIDVWYDSPAIKINTNENGNVTSIVVKRDGEGTLVETKGVILACGSFEGNKKMRAEHLGEEWNHAILRGTEFNTGDGFSMAMEVGAQAFGQWSMGHALAKNSVISPLQIMKVVQGSTLPQLILTY